MGIERCIVVAVVGCAVADLHAVAVAVHRPGRAHHPVGHRINRGAAGGRKVGAVVVGTVNTVGVAIVAADRSAGRERTAEIETAIQVRRGVFFVLSAGITVQFGRCLLIGAAAFLGDLGGGFGLGLLLGQVGVGLLQGVGKLAAGGVQRLLLGLQRIAGFLGPGGGRFGLLPAGVQRLGFGVQLFQQRGVVGRNVIQRMGIGQQLEQIGCLAQQRNAAAVLQLLHRAQLLAGLVQLGVILGLFGCERCGGGLGFTGCGVQFGLGLLQQGIDALQLGRNLICPPFKGADLLLGFVHLVFQRFLLLGSLFIGLAGGV